MAAARNACRASFGLMIVGGDPIVAAEALKSGLIEEVVESSLNGGNAFVRR